MSLVVHWHLMIWKSTLLLRKSWNSKQIAEQLLECTLIRQQYYSVGFFVIPLTSRRRPRTRRRSRIRHALREDVNRLRSRGLKHGVHLSNGRTIYISPNPFLYFIGSKFQCHVHVVLPRSVGRLCWKTKKVKQGVTNKQKISHTNRYYCDSSP